MLILETTVGVESPLSELLGGHEARCSEPVTNYSAVQLGIDYIRANS